MEKKENVVVIEEKKEKEIKEKDKFGFKIPLELAENELKKYAEEMDIDCDTSDMDLEDKTAFDKIQKRIIKAIRRGHLTFNDDYSEATYTPHNKRSKHKEPITFYERDGSTLSVMDRKKKSQEVAKMKAVIVEMSTLNIANYNTLKGEDVKMCEALFSLLMD